MDSQIQAAIYGGLIASGCTLVVTVVTLFLEIVRMRREKDIVSFAEMEKLRCDKRWDAAAEIWGAFIMAFELLKSFASLHDDKKLEEDSQETYAACVKFNDALRAKSLFLDKTIRNGLLEAVKEFKNASRDLKFFHAHAFFHEGTAQQLTDEDRTVYTALKAKCKDEGDFGLMVEGISDSLRQHLEIRSVSPIGN